jgi:hypothetical protein
MKQLTFLLALFAVFAITSCSKSIEEERHDYKITEIKTVLDIAAEDLNTPALKISREEIDQAMRGEHRYSNLSNANNCQDWCFKRTVQGVNNSTEYRVNTMTLIGQLLPVYGQTVDPNDPRDMSGDGMVNSDDLLLMLGYFGNTFETVPLSEISATGGAVSGTGEFAYYGGDVFVNGDNLTLVSLQEGSNCLIQDYSSELYTGEDCLSYAMLTFNTNIGTVKYFYIN